MWVITFEVKNWYLLSRVGCDHPCIYFLFSCGYLRLFLILVVCLCTYVHCFCYLGTFLFLAYLFWWFLTFCFAGVVALPLTMRTLCHLGVGVESHALAFCKKCLKIQKKNLFVVFGSSVLYLICFKSRKFDY